MKRISCLFFVLLFILNVSACEGLDISQTDSENGVQLQVYYGSLMDSNINHLSNEMSAGVRTCVEEERKQDTINNIFGYDVDALSYVQTGAIYGMQNERITYKNDKYYVMVDKQTGDIDLANFAKPFKEYREYTEEIDIETAEKRAKEFIDTFYGHRIDLSAYTQTKSGTKSYGGYYEFTWIEYIHGIDTGIVYVMTDFCGNIYEFWFNERAKYKDKIPEYTDEQYLEACAKKLKADYEEQGIQAEITNVCMISGIDKKALYADNGDKYCVEFVIAYDVVVPGKEKATTRQARMYLPYAENET